MKSALLRTTVNELFKDALPIIKIAAPSVASAIGGPIGAAFGYVIPILSSAFDAGPGNLTELVTNISKDPNAQSKLQTIEREHGDWLSQLMDNVNSLAKAEINIKLEWEPSTP